MCRLLGHRWCTLFYGMTCTRCGHNSALLAKVIRTLAKDI